MGNNKLYVITGAPSSGKSTLLSELEKLGHKTVPEVARQIIEEALSDGKSLDQIRKDEIAFQKSVFERAIKREQDIQKNITTFLDRGIHDVVAYLSHYNHDLDDESKKIVSNHTYQKVFLLDPLPTFHKDHVRSEAADFATEIHDQLDRVYEAHGMKPIRVPVLPIPERVKFILDNL